ncbi:TPA: hypothetical protein ACOEBE_004265, partial [Stenotrophomonas maltophilia]
AEKAKIAISEFLENNKGSLSWEDYQSLMEVGSAMVGGALGGSTGANIAVTGDRFNRQLHISEIDLIQGSASGFAQRLCGCRNPSREQIDAAEKSLSEQAYRQVQFGVEGQWDQAASDYLRQVSAGRLLEPDPNRPGSGYSPLFYATPGEKADATQYVGSWNLRADFYRKTVWMCPRKSRQWPLPSRIKLIARPTAKCSLEGRLSLRQLDCRRLRWPLRVAA